MTKIAWGQPGERLFETGIDRGVLYPETGPGVPWNGLISVTEAPDGGEPTPFYFDGEKFLNILSSEEYAATIEALSAPPEFRVSDGTAQMATGLFVTGQPRKPFDLCYRTKVGNDISSDGLGYKLHLIYNAYASPSEKANTTISDSAEAVVLSWPISTIPVKVSGFKSSSHLVVDSTLVNSLVMMDLEEVLYGTEVTQPSMPTPQDLIYILTGVSPP